LLRSTGSSRIFEADLFNENPTFILRDSLGY
jgi:hypothetical protein